MQIKKPLCKNQRAVYSKRVTILLKHCTEKISIRIKSILNRLSRGGDGVILINIKESNKSTVTKN